MNESIQPIEQKKGSSTRVVLIILAIAAVTAILAFAVIAAAVGIFIYSATSESDHVPGSTTKAENAENPAAGFPEKKPGSATRNDALVSAMRERPEIGGFTLQNVVPAYAGRAYVNSEGEVKGIYSSDGKTVTLVVAEYQSKSDATMDFGRMIGRARAGGAKVVSNIAAKDKTIYAAFEKGELKTVAFCNLEAETAVICNHLSSEDGRALEQFSRSFIDSRQR